MVKLNVPSGLTVDDVGSAGVIVVFKWTCVVVSSGVGVTVDIDIDIVILDEADGSGLDVFSAVVTDENIDIIVSNEVGVDGPTDSADVLATGEVSGVAPDESICVLVSSEVVDVGPAIVVRFIVVVSIDASDDLAELEDSRSAHVVFPAR